MGNITRAGATGSIDTEKLKEANYGFGVFAYYTGKDTYGSYMRVENGLYKSENARVTAGEDKTANFMFNQKVTWNQDKADDNYVTGWEYSPLKYWPNEISATANTADDDQNDDQSNDPAIGSGEYGGNVSFFAYAPYVDMSASTWTDGITAINGQTTLAAANAVGGDPTISYKLNTSGDKVVDLLWGTTSSNGKGVTEAANAGVISTAALDEGKVVTSPTNAATYAAEILRSSTSTPITGYTMNADLTKQKTTGTVGFAFKHALAKVGGSGTTTTTTTGGTTTTTTSGLQVMLDLDDQKGEEIGGSKSDDTKVTIKSITIEAYSLSEKTTTTGSPSTTTYTYLKSAEGVLNLATGKWALNTESSNVEESTSDNTTPPAIPNDAAKTTHNILPEYESTNRAAILNDLIAEAQYSGVTGDSYGWGEQPAGVLITPQNVYKDEANPLVFIPGTYPDLKVTVDYIVRTKDDNLNAGSTCIGQKITKRLTFEDPVQLNKQYSLLIRLGLTSVKFKATVSDWEVVGSTTTTTDENGDVNITDMTDEHLIYVPRNVKGPVVSGFAINDNESTPAALTSIKAGDEAKDVVFTVAGTKKKELQSSSENITYDDIEVLSAPSWVTVTSTSSNHKITVAANGTNATREGTIVLAVKDAANPEQAKKEITVKQYGKLQVTTNTKSFASTGVTSVAFIQSLNDTDGNNVTSPTYSIKAGGTDVTGASVTDGKLTLDDNTGTNVKTMTVDIVATTADGETVHANQITITQAAKGLTVSITSPTNAELANTAGTQAVTWSIDGSAWTTGNTGEENVDWITAIAAADGAITTTANTTPKKKQTTVTVHKDDATGDVTVYQLPGTVTVENLSIKAGETKSLIVKVGDVNYLLKDTANRTITIKDGSNNDVSTFTVTAGTHQNTITVPSGTAAGSYTITVQLDDAVVSSPATITVSN